MVDSTRENSNMAFLQYHEPDIIGLLSLLSFFFVLSLARWAVDKICGAGLIGQLIIGVLYGVPVGNILLLEWQEAFVAVGYLGLILIIFEGGITMRLDLLQRNFVLGLCAAAVGILAPFALSFLLLYLGFGYGAIETFIVAAALSTTSVGTTFVVLKSAATEDASFAATRVGIVLISAALFDDIVGLIMISVIQNLGALSAGQGVNIGWLIGRPIVASVCIGLIPPLLAVFVFKPLYRRYVEEGLNRIGSGSLVVVEALVLGAFLAVAYYIGASVLFGAFMAGAFLGVLPSAPIGEENSEASTRPSNENVTAASAASHLPTFADGFEHYAASSMRYVFEPLFFSSMGFAIPFKSLRTAEAVWKGISFSVLMFIGKVLAGVCVFLWDITPLIIPGSKELRGKSGALIREDWPHAMLLGCAMVARGEVGLLIIQIGTNQTSFVSEPAFVTAVWAIVLDTIVGPLLVGFLIRAHGSQIAKDPRWGLQGQDRSPGLRESHELTRPQG